MRLLFYLLLLVCMVQAHRGIDLSGYLLTVSKSFHEGLSTPPYPTGKAQNGDFFQSPLTTVLLIPFSLLPISFTKWLFACFYSLGLLIFLEKLKTKKLPGLSQFTLLLFFAHALSDVFLSLNFLFPVVVLLWLSHEWSLSSKKHKQAASGLAFSLALALRPFPALLFPFFLLTPKRRAIVPWIFLFGFLELALTFLVFPEPIRWWESWLTSLRLYSEAAYVLGPTFQTPLSNLDRMAHYLFGVPITKLGLLEGLGALGFLIPSYFFAFKLEKSGKSTLAFAVLLSLLFCCFSRIWASGFLYCLPLLVFAAGPNRKILLILAVGYALLPKWAWPVETWNYLMGIIGLQGWFITAAIAYSWGSILFSNPGKNTELPQVHRSHFWKS